MQYSTLSFEFPQTKKIGGGGARVVKADFLKDVREAVAQRLIKAVKRLLYVVNKTNDCFKMHLTSVRLWASTFHY